MSHIAPAEPPVNDLETLAYAIRTADQGVAHATGKLLHFALQVGDALLQAKEKIAHGDWLNYLSWDCNISKLHKWLAGADFLIGRADYRELLAVAPLQFAVEVVTMAEQGGCNEDQNRRIARALPDRHDTGASW